MKNSIRTIFLLFFSVSLAGAEEPVWEQFNLFEKEIRPALAQHCYECHSTKEKVYKGGLSLDTPSGWLSGGNRGAAVIPGKPEESLLMDALTHKTKKLSMPKQADQLPEAVIQAFERWIAQGAPAPEEHEGDEPKRVTIDIEEGRQFWSFKPVQKISPPKLKNDNWAKTSVDKFVRKGQIEEGVEPVKLADRHTLIRRLSFDLTGLPPTPEQIDAFVKDTDPEAYANLVDRLLASERFGERWGRHWLDLARYAESMGKTRNYPFPHAWRYRDYVIKAFNQDTPYDQFVREQLAGDLLPSGNKEERNDRLVATGFLAIGSHDLNERDGKKYAMDVIAEQIDTSSRALIGMTMACARCHDHKFDPISTEDYYAMAGIFKSTETLNGYLSRQGGGNRLVKSRLHDLELGAEKDVDREAQARSEKMEGQLAGAKRALQRLKAQDRALKTNKDLPPVERKQEVARLKKEIKAKTQAVARIQKEIKNSGNEPIGDVAMGMREAQNLVECMVNIKGDAHNLGKPVARGFPAVMAFDRQPPIPGETSGRLAMAEWLTHPDHPLTARVMVNRIWHHLYGRGIVRTVDNFGTTGERPINPELLDYLASRFVETHRWSVKSMIRELVGTKTYQLSSAHHDKNYDVDPENLTFWRMNRKRLDAEALRDALLVASGKLNLVPAEGSPMAKVNAKEMRDSKSMPAGTLHRSVYQPVVRDQLQSYLSLFDFPTPSEVKGNRDATTIAPQALFMLNNNFVIKQSKEMADRLLAREDLNARERMDELFLRTVGRSPGEGEVGSIAAYLDERKNDKVAESLAWAEVAQSLFAAAEFRILN